MLRTKNMLRKYHSLRERMIHGEDYGNNELIAGFFDMYCECMILWMESQHKKGLRCDQEEIENMLKGAE